MTTSPHQCSQITTYYLLKISLTAVDSIENNNNNNYWIRVSEIYALVVFGVSSHSAFNILANSPLMYRPTSLCGDTVKDDCVKGEAGQRNQPSVFCHSKEDFSGEMWASSLPSHSFGSALTVKLIQVLRWYIHSEGF